MILSRKFRSILFIYSLYNDSFSFSDNTASNERMLLNNELERMQKILFAVAEDFHSWGRRALTLLNYILEFALQLRKRTENLFGSRVVKSLVASTCHLLKDSLVCPVDHQSSSGDLSQPLVGISAFQIASSPYKVTLSRSTWLGLCLEEGYVGDWHGLSHCTE